MTLKQGTKLVGKGSGGEHHIGGVCGEGYFIVNTSTGYGVGYGTEKEILESFTIVEEKWEPKKGDVYSFVDDRGVCSFDNWHGDNVDLFRRDYLGVYQTKEEAQTARENMKKIG